MDLFSHRQWRSNWVRNGLPTYLGKGIKSCVVRMVPFLFYLEVLVRSQSQCYKDQISCGPLNRVLIPHGYVSSINAVYVKSGLLR